jgi:hypothetical protein
MNDKFTKQAIPNVNHFLVAKIHQNQYVTSPNKQHIEHKNLHATQLNLQEFVDGHKKLPFAEEESTYHCQRCYYYGRQRWNSVFRKQKINSPQQSPTCELMYQTIFPEMEA